MEFCINCKHYQRSKNGLLGGLVEINVCRKQPPEHDLVTGQPLYRFANVERTIVNEPNHCGKEGKWFEFKVEDADLDDLSTIPFGR